MSIHSKYTSALNYRTLISLVISIFATWLSYKYDLKFNLDLTLISVAVVFPLVFTLGSAFQRRDKALEHLSRAKAALATIYYSFTQAREMPEKTKEKIYDSIKNVKLSLIEFLSSHSNDRSKLNQSISHIKTMVEEHKDSLGRGLSLRVYRYMRDVLMGIENTIAIKFHRTPQSIRAYCELFIYVFPFYYAPTLMYNIETGDNEILNSSGEIFSTVITGTHHPFVVYGLNMIISFILISLYNVQEQIEDPFDNEGLDDVMLDMYKLDYEDTPKAEEKPTEEAKV